MVQAIEAPARLILAWMEYALHPIDSTNALLQEQNATLFPKSLIEIWATSAVILMLIALPVSCLFGISIKDADFFGFWQAMILIFHVILAVTVHAILVVFGQHSDLSDIIKLYTIRIVYIPIIGILNLPGTYQLYNKIRAAKRNETDPLSLLSSLVTPTENGLLGLDEIGTVLSFAIMFPTAAVFTEAVIAWYGNRRFLSYLAVGTAGVLAMFSLIGMGLPLYIFNIYAHVQ